MKIGKNEVESIIITRDDEVIAVISDKDIVEKEKYKVIMEPVK